MITKQGKGCEHSESCKMSTSPCVPFLPFHGLLIRWSTWVLGAQPRAPYRRRGKQRTGHSLCPRGVSTLRGGSNNTSETIRKLNRGEPSTRLSGSALRNSMRNTSGPSEAEGSLRKQSRVGRAGLAEKKSQEVGGRGQPDQAETPSPGQDGGMEKGGVAPLCRRQSTPRAPFRLSSPGSQGVALPLARNTRHLLKGAGLPDS